MIAPRTLFGRTALVIALVSFAFQMFTIAVITYFARCRWAPPPMTLPR
jgi:hypothetical protein